MTPAAAGQPALTLSTPSPTTRHVVLLPLCLPPAVLRPAAAGRALHPAALQLCAHPHQPDTEWRSAALPLLAVAAALALCAPLLLCLTCTLPPSLRVCPSRCRLRDWEVQGRSTPSACAAQRCAVLCFNEPLLTLRCPCSLPSVCRLRTAPVGADESLQASKLRPRRPMRHLQFPVRQRSAAAQMQAATAGGRGAGRSAPGLPLTRRCLRLCCCCPCLSLCQVITSLCSRA